MLTLVTGLSLLRNLLGLELLHLGLQRLLKVGLTLPVLLQNQPYKLVKFAPAALGRPLTKALWGLSLTSASQAYYLLGLNYFNNPRM